MTPRETVAYLDHFQHRVLQDALAEGMAAYWRRRARQFDSVGNARCDEIARACRNRALLAERGGEPWVTELFEDVFTPHAS